MSTCTTLVALRRIAFAATSLLAATSVCQAQSPTETYGSGTERFTLATGSPGELGLLKALAESFAQEAGAQMVWHKAGTGASLKLLKERKVDMVMVHAPGEEEKAVQEGWATKRTLIGSNEFYILGPEADPAGIKAAGGAAESARVAQGLADIELASIRDALKHCRGNVKQAAQILGINRSTIYRKL
jgi:tungstate transport system substrate-binding protein